MRRRRDRRGVAASATSLPAPRRPSGSPGRPGHPPLRCRVIAGAVPGAWACRTGSSTSASSTRVLRGSIAPRMGRLGLGGARRAPPAARHYDRQSGRPRAYGTWFCTTRLTSDLEANRGIIVDAFNENYHAAHLHTISRQDVKDGRLQRLLRVRPQRDDGHPVQGRAGGADETARPPGLAICHYTIFPTSVFNNNPDHLQLFRAVPIAVGPDQVRNLGAVVSRRRRRVPEKLQHPTGSLGVVAGP